VPVAFEIVSVGKMFGGVTVKNSVLEREALHGLRAPFGNVQRFFLMVLIAPFSRRETCAWEMPTSADTSICVFPS